METPIQRKAKKRFAPRQSNNDIPPGWTHDPSQKRSVYRCPVIENAINEKTGLLERRRCIVTKRRYEIHTHTENSKHIFSCPSKEDQGFHNISKKESLPIEVRNSQILRQIALLCGQLNIPSRKG